MKKLFIILFILLSAVTYRHQSYSKELLRQAYVTKLMSYLSTPYVWGGEGHRGIDCSGLVRRAYRDALRETGRSYLRPSLIIEAYWLEKMDFRARELATLPSLFLALEGIPEINGTDSANLHAGDLAVIQDGTHVMAYLGHDDWIEANKSNGRVIIVHTPETELKHYQNPVTLYRWRQLKI